MENLNSLLMVYTSNTHFAEDPLLNFNIGLEYEKLNQFASAFSYYLRAAERTYDIHLQYECLLRTSICFDSQKNRPFATKGQIQKAISLIPNRPEGYFLLAKCYENENQDNKWHDCYMVCNIGLQFINHGYNDLLTDVGYSNENLYFLKGLSSWWIGLCEDAREIMYDLQINYDIVDKQIKKAIDNNVLTMGYPNRYSIKTSKDQYSQVGQDIFVLESLNYKQNGYYLEIGSNDPIINNNTYLLESKYNWKGISIEIDGEMVKKFNHYRKNQCICKNALHINYASLLNNFKSPLIIDYLSIDCEPSETSFEVLKLILKSNYIFKIITFEHDYYVNNNSIKDQARQLLLSNGYDLIKSDVCCDIQQTKPFEDWFIFKQCIARNI